MAEFPVLVAAVAAETTYEAKSPTDSPLEEEKAGCEATWVSAATMVHRFRLGALAVNCFSHAESWPPLGLTTLAVTCTVEPLQTAGPNLVRDRLIG